VAKTKSSLKIHRRCANFACSAELTAVNIRKGHLWCDRCSGRYIWNIKLARPAPEPAPKPEQMEMFPDAQETRHTSRRKR
jgi:hypothetical protein